MATFNKERLGHRYRRALGDAGKTSDRTEKEFVERSTGYDPYEAAERSSRASFEGIREDLGESIEDLRGQQVGMGRLRTGFATGDEDRLVTTALDHLNREIASNSLRAAGLDLQNIGNIGNFSGQSTNRYLDLLSGGLDRAQQEENARRKKRGGIGSLIGAGIGTLIAPGVGTTLGAALGGTAGELF